MKRIFFDMDGVLAEYKKDCTPRDLSEKGYFLTLSPEWNMLRAMMRLVENAPALGISVCVLTKVYPKMFRYSVSEKLQWRDKFMPQLFDSEFIMVNGDCEEKSDKICEVYGEDINSDCILIDDYNPNLAEWRKNGGTAVKYVNGINDKNRSFIGARLSNEMSEQEIYDSILQMIYTSSPAPAAA